MNNNFYTLECELKKFTDPLKIKLLKHLMPEAVEWGFAHYDVKYECKLKNNSIIHELLDIGFNYICEIDVGTVVFTKNDIIVVIGIGDNRCSIFMNYDKKEKVNDID